MARKHWLTLYRALVLLALLASALLYVHYLSPADSEFCGEEGGCETVRQSGFSYFGSAYLNIPLLGLVSYSVLYALAWGAPSVRRSNLVRILSGLGGVIALLFVLWQALLIGAFCWLCLIVDGAAVAAAFAAHAAHSARTEQIDPLKPWAWGGLWAALVLLPSAWYLVRPLPPVPGPIHELFAADKINVIEFADFQCPYCRRVHPILTELVKEYGDRVHFKRLHMPLPHHILAEGAAKAAVCATQQGKSEQMADLLFEGRLGDKEYPKYARQLGLDLERFDACLQDPATLAVIDADIARFRAAELRGLPTTFIGEERITGARPVATFRSAFEKAASNQRGFALSGGVYLALCAGVLLALLLLGRKPTPAAAVNA